MARAISDPQRVPAVGVMALVRDDRRELGRARTSPARPRTRTRGDAASPEQNARGSAPGTTGTLRPPISRVPTTGSAAATRRCAATPRHSERPPCNSAKESNRISAISSSSPAVMELQVRQRRTARQQQGVVEPQTVDDEQQRQQERGDAERGDRELGRLGATRRAL